MFENRQVRPITRTAFHRRLRFHGLVAIAVLCVSLLLGMFGYHFLEQLPWIDAYANAAMILSGMGPLDPVKTSAGKIFAGAYALFSGVVFLTTVGFFLAPIVHRLLHKFHFDSKSES